MKLSPPTKGLLLSLLGFAAFSISDAFSKLLTGRLNPFEVAFSGGVFGLLLVPFVKTRGQSWLNILPIQKPGMWWIRAAATFVATAASVESFMLLSMPEALSLMFLMPFIATILSVVALKEKVSPWGWVAVAIGFAGVLIVLRPGVRPLHFGHACALAAAIASAVNVIAYRVAGTGTTKLGVLGSSLAGPLLGDGLLALPNFTWPETIADWGNLFGYGFLAALGQLLIMLAATLTPASRVALPQYTQMVWAVLFSYTLFHEPLDKWTIIGVTVVTLSGMLDWFRKHLLILKQRRLARKQARLQPANPTPADAK
ncbi:drug/metabolite transporter integral membrane protein [Acetobacter senegalensis DSM 18889]|nr:drug/metabolite transporter integral membrane protein [Acetobacter senegalensis DSM 18889]